MGLLELRTAVVDKDVNSELKDFPSQDFILLIFSFAIQVPRTGKISECPAAMALKAAHNIQHQNCAII